MEKRISTGQYKKYMPMLSSYTEDKATSLIKQTVSIFKRHDRIVWALREHRYAALLSKASSLLTNTEKRHIREHRHDNGKTLSEYNLYSFQHYLSQGLHDIDRVNFARETISEILAKLEYAESRYLSRLKESDSFLKPSGKRLIDISDKLTWWDLETPYSKEEGISGRTCGNSHYKAGDTILSLREKSIINGQELWQTKLTFIYNEKNAYLGEMKGRANTKPNSIYHDAIVTLLSSLTGLIELRGAVHDNTDDFCIGDLSKADMNRIIATRPDLSGHTNIDLNAHPDALSGYTKLYLGRLATIEGSGLKGTLVLANKIVTHNARTQNRLNTSLMTFVYAKSINCRSMAISESECNKAILDFVASRCATDLQLNFDIGDRCFVANTLFQAYNTSPKRDAIEGVASVLEKVILEGTANNALFILAKHYPNYLPLIKQCA